MSEPFKLATLPFRPGQRLGVMISDDEVEWRRACGATVTSEGWVTFDETVTGRFIMFADENVSPAHIVVEAWFVADDEQTTK
jgi:hypothetical protein